MQILLLIYLNSIQIFVKILKKDSYCLKKEGKICKNLKYRASLKDFNWNKVNPLIQLKIKQKEELEERQVL
jgi:hypothetical protein